jgi:hypothetical protein
MNEATSCDESRTTPQTPDDNHHASVSTPEAEATFRKKNARRIALIKKKNREGLSPAELEEFEKLQQACYTYMDARFPRPAVDLEGLQQLAAQLEAEKDSQSPS